jgi:hypothetical protein
MEGPIDSACWNLLPCVELWFPHCPQSICAGFRLAGQKGTLFLLYRFDFSLLPGNTEKQKPRQARQARLCFSGSGFVRSISSVQPRVKKN